MFREKKLKLALTPDEVRLIINSLNEFRNKLIAKGEYTDYVDELLIKLCK